MRRAPSVVGAARRLWARWVRQACRLASRDDPAREAMQEVFARIYRTRAWGPAGSASGPGSGIERTALLRDELARLVKDLAVGTFLDAGCGDFHWMKEADFTIGRYIGVDVVPEIVARNTQLHATTTREFRVVDITRDPLPQADLIFCRDCLVHLPLGDAVRALENFVRSGATYLLATTFTARQVNHDIALGDWRTLNLQRAPFDLPGALRVIDDCPPDPGDYTDKRLGLWRLAARRRWLRWGLGSLDEGLSAKAPSGLGPARWPPRGSGRPVRPPC